MHDCSTWRARLVEFIRQQALPPDKFSHQARLYALACRVGAGLPYDDEVVFAGIWLHDLGVFIGQRPEDPAALATWDHVAHAVARSPGILRDCGFPEARIPAVLEVIEHHMPHNQPTTVESELVRDADILEQLGAVGILRTVSKVGRDTRFIRFSDALRVLRKNLETLPGELRLESARRLSEPRTAALRTFLEAAEAEAGTVEW